MKILFVHLGGKIPHYLIKNILLTSRNFETHEVFLITDQTISLPESLALKTFQILLDDSFHQLEERLSHPRDFRKNFWFSTSARFLAIAKFSETENGPYLHVESDVLLSQDFPLPRFSNLEKDFAFPVNSPLTGIASTVFFRDKNATKEFANFVLNSASSDENTNDMRILKQFYDLNTSRVKLLPIGGLSTDSYTADIPRELVVRIHESANYFGGVFDAAEFGPFLYGYDPRNFRGLSPIRLENRNSFCHVGNCKIVFDKNRNFLSLMDKNGSLIPIYSLHLHVKRSSLFSPWFYRLVSKGAVRRVNRPAKRRFYIFVFLQLLIKACLKRIRRLR
jgi:hypothetical protein